MKTVLSVFCCLCVVVLLTGCDNGDDGGSSGGPGDFPDVSFLLNETTGQATCYNADNSVITTKQTCTWNCAYYNGGGARRVTLVFAEDLVCTETADNTYNATVDKTTDIAAGTIKETYADTSSGSVSSDVTCEEEFALVSESFGPCNI